MAYVKPQVLVQQEFTAAADVQDTELRAWVVGPNAIVHDMGEAPLGAFSAVPSSGLDTAFPGISAGSTIDEDSVRVYAQNAVLEYAHVEGLAEVMNSSVYAHNAAGTPNTLLFHNFNLKTNGTYARNVALGTRDVQIGDRVEVSAYAAAIPGVTQCENIVHETEVLDYVVQVSDGVIGTAIRQTNPGTRTASVTGYTGAAASGTYTGTYAEEVYSVKVATSGSTCTYTVTSASGTDSYPNTAATPTTVSENHVFTIGRCGITVSAAALPEADFTVSVTSAAFTSADPERVHADIYDASETLTLSGTYNPLETGFRTQVYRIQVTAKHNTAACKNLEFRILSESGLDDSLNVQAVSAVDGYSFPVTSDVTALISTADFATVEVGDSWAYKLTGAYSPASVTASGTYIGSLDDTYAVTCVAGGTVGSATDKPEIYIRTLSGSDSLGPVTLTGTAAQTSLGVTFTFTEAAMMLGETWIVKVTSGKNTAVRGLLLRDSLPAELRSASDANPVILDVRLCAVRDVELTNFSVSNKRLTLPAAQTVSQDDFSTALTLRDGGLSVAYTEYSARGVGKLNYIANTTALDDIPGKLEPSNPLKYALYKALSNAGGTTVAYTPVLGDSLDAWQTAFNAGVGSRDVYTLVPLSQNIQVLNLAADVVKTDSNEETCAWKNCFLNVEAPATLMRVGQSNSTLHPTSLDGQKVYGTISSSGTLEITSRYNGKANASLANVVPGDEVRVFTGASTYTSFVVDTVTGDTLTVLNPRAVALESSIEIWHTMTKTEQVEYVVDAAQSLSHRRVKLVWPDIAGEGAYELPGTFLCAALAGLLSGSLPNQSMTRVSIAGFDDMTRSLGQFNDTQVKALAEGGVWTVIEDLDGTVYTMHGVTTLTGDSLTSEEMSTRVMDFASFTLRTILERYIGVTNVTDKTMTNIRLAVRHWLEAASASNYSAAGPLFTAFSIVDLAQDDLLKDRINLTVSVTLPRATNNIMLRIQAE